MYRWEAYLLGGLPHEHEPLGVRHDLGSVKSLFEVIDELLLVATERLLLGSSKDLGSTATLLLDRRQATREDSLTNKRDCVSDQRYDSELTHIFALTRHASIESSNSSPLSGTLLTSRVEDLGDNGLTVVIVELENLGGDFDQEGIEDALVPCQEDVGNLAFLETETTLEDVVCLSNQLHVTVFDT